MSYYSPLVVYNLFSSLSLNISFSLSLRHLVTVNVHISLFVSPYPMSFLASGYLFSVCCLVPLSLIISFPVFSVTYSIIVSVLLLYIIIIKALSLFVSFSLSLSLSRCLSRLYVYLSLCVVCLSHCLDVCFVFPSLSLSLSPTHTHHTHSLSLVWGADFWGSLSLSFIYFSFHPIVCEARVFWSKLSILSSCTRNCTHAHTTLAKAYEVHGIA